MKNIFKLFTIIAITAVIAFSMLSCDLDPGDDGVAKTLEITSIPITGTDSLKEKLITVAFCDLDKNNKPVIRAFNQATVSTATVSLPLFSAKDNKKGEAFTGTGDYYIFIFVDVNNTNDNFNDDTTYYYTGGGQGAYKYNIKKGDAKISLEWSKFTKSNS